jgi:pimeloyl-ACP methyl ester carboxylesterase
MAMVFGLAVGASGTAFVLAEEKAAPKEKSAKVENPPPEDLKIPTRDGVELALSYYPGSKGKESVPVVLLHMWKQNRNDYKDLATLLQSQGCAVIVPDLRGHGESTQRIGVRKDEMLKAASMPTGQFPAMVTMDMEAIKKFLWEKNNAGELNIDKLCLVGAEMGASVALNFTMADALDQDRNRVRRPEFQLGRFVKALVLISPELSFRGLPIRAGNINLIPDVALLFVVGRKDSKALEEATRLHAMFERYHPEPTGENILDRKTLFFGKLDTSLQGTKLLDPKFNLSAIIADFIHRRLVKSEESKLWAWQERKFPHG